MFSYSICPYFWRQTASELEEPKIGIWGKGLNTIQSIKDNEPFITEP